MTLMDRWKMLISQGAALVPVALSPLAYANQVALTQPEWTTTDKSPVFNNTLNAPDAVNIYAAHRSHSSHSSHRSHSSHSSHYSGSGGYSAPRSYTPPASAYSAPSTTANRFSGSSSRPASTTPSAAPARTSATADRNQLVMRVQMALLVKQYYSGSIDGVLGNGTRGALMAFQADSNLQNHGRMDTPTLNALGIAIP